MELEIRQAKPEEMDEFNKVANDAIMIPGDEDDPIRDHTITLCAFKDGKLATSYCAFDYNIVINGGVIPVAAVSMVGTNSIYRMLGCLRKVTSRHFEILHEEQKQPISALYASQATIYRRYGYSSVVLNGSYSIEPRFIEFIEGPIPTGSFHEAGESDIPVFSQLYDSFIEPRTGYLKRNEEMWKHKFKTSKKPDAKKHYMIYEEGGEPKGYVIFTNRVDPTWDQHISINDYVWHTPSAYRAILEFFGRMYIVKEITYHGVSMDDPLHHLLLEPRKLNRKIGDGLYARIVDIERALDKRVYDEEGTLTFKIHDNFCPWNEGTYKLETSPEGSKISRTQETPQIEMPVSTLPLLFFGTISATRAYQMGRLDVNDTGSLPVWDKVMKTKYSPACADDF